MATNPSTTSTPSLSTEVTTPPYSTTPRAFYQTVSWGAIFAGLTAALGFQVLFMMLGSGLGLAMYHPLTSEDPVGNLGTGALVVQGVSAVISLWLGGWVAGRLTPTGSRTTGWLHGLCVWCASTIAGVVLVSSGAGWAMGDLSKVVGGGLSAAGKPLAAAVGGATDLAKDAAQKSGDSFSSFVDEAMNTHATDPNAPRAGGIRAKRELSMAVARMFNPLQDSTTAENRTTLVRTMVDTAGMSEADANRMVDEWTASYNRLKTELNDMKNQAEAKARVAAEKTARALTVFSLCAFGSFVLGAASSLWGGSVGARASREAELQAGAEHIAAQDRHYA